MNIQQLETHLGITHQILIVEQTVFEKYMHEHMPHISLIKDSEGDYDHEYANTAFICWVASKYYLEDNIVPFNPENNVKNPNYYQILDSVEAIDIIACSLTKEQFKGFCLGNILKYRIRAGKKESVEQDISKANDYENIFNYKKHLCKKGD